MESKKETQVFTRQSNMIGNSFQVGSLASTERKDLEKVQSY